MLFYGIGAQFITVERQSNTGSTQKSFLHLIIDPTTPPPKKKINIYLTILKFHLSFIKLILVINILSYTKPQFPTSFNSNSHPSHFCTKLVSKTQKDNPLGSSGHVANCIAYTATLTIIGIWHFEFAIP